MAEVARQADISFQSNLYEDSNPTRRGLHLKRRAWVEAALLAHLPASGRVIEVGVGCGIFTRFLQRHGAQVTAVDINADFIAAIRHLPDVHATVCDATRKMSLGLHDLALCTEVIEHVPRERSLAMLRSIAASLNPGGRLVLTTPQRFATVELMARLLKFPPILALARRLYGSADELGHINLLTARVLRAQIAEAGFAVERHELFGFYLPVVAEFGGGFGARLLARLGRTLAGVPVLRNLIWTQAYVLRKI
jgi:SAM-dependent methyltransferase